MNEWNNIIFKLGKTTTSDFLIASDKEVMANYRGCNGYMEWQGRNKPPSPFLISFTSLSVLSVEDTSCRPRHGISIYEIEPAAKKMYNLMRSKIAILSENIDMKHREFGRYVSLRRENNAYLYALEEFCVNSELKCLMGLEASYGPLLLICDVIRNLIKEMS